MPMKHLEYLLGQGIGVDEILIGLMQATGIIGPVYGIGLPQIIMETLQDMQARMGVGICPKAFCGQ